MGDNMKTISLINMKGGVGKTTMAVNIADCLATRYEKRVLLIDVDPQYNATQCLMQPDEYYNHVIGEKDTIINIFERDNHMDVSLVTGASCKDAKPMNCICPVNIKNRLDLIPGALDLYKIEMAAGEGKEFGIRQYLETVKDKYDYVIIDTPPTPSVWMVSALLASDYYLIPTKADPISLTGIDLLSSIIQTKSRRYGIDKLSCCGVIITVAEINTNNYKNAIKNLNENERWKNKLFTYSLIKRVEMAQRQLNQEFILDMSDAELKRNLVNIVAEMLKRVGDEVNG